MSQENADSARRVVESAYEAMSRRDLDGWLDHATPDFSISELPDLPDADVYRGREEARRWAETTLASLEEWKWTAEEFLFNDGSTVLVRVLLTGRSAAGVPVEMTVFHVFAMRGDKLGAVRAFLDEAQALESAELPAES